MSLGVQAVLQKDLHQDPLHQAPEPPQRAYEDFVKETTAAIEAKSKEIVKRSWQKYKAEQNLSRIHN